MLRSFALVLLAAGVTPFAGFVAAADAPQALELQPGDHICYVGNTLADRMQHHGWLETLIHARFPKHQLVFRNLGFSGDELTLRLRSSGFGSPDDWLKRCEATVVFAFFGYNESFAGEAGLPKFKQDLAAYLKHLQATKYSPRGATRVVLFSPLAHENLRSPHLPSGEENNARIALYTAAMREVAAAEGVQFVDLFSASGELYKSAAQPLTINGVHLHAAGDQVLAPAIVARLFGGAATQNLTPAALEKLRQAVLDKNLQWFERYRTTDGFSIYGGRADLRFVNGQSNREVAQREMEILDVTTANRDQRIWALAQGGDLVVDDSNTPDFIPVISNKPGPLPGGQHLFLGGEQAIQRMTIAKGLKVELFASEEQFPELINPVQMAFDTKGRLWVACWPLYPHWTPKHPRNDMLLILEDTNGDGRADKRTVFAGDLHNPTGFEFWNGGVLVANAPDLLFLKDTDGDDRYDVLERVINGLDSADTHHTANSFTLDPGGALYFQEGTFHHSQVETAWGPPARVANGAVFRYEPRAQKFEVYVSHGFANPHGHVFDRWGQDIVIDGTGAVPYHGALFSGSIDFPQKHSSPPTVYGQRTRPCPGLEILSSQHFPEEFEGNLLVPNVIGFQGILRYKLHDKDSSLGATELEPILSSSDPNFRPADVETGPDGAIYFTDWHNPIIGHMQHNLRDPNRNKTHGRVYRVTCEGRPLVTPPKIAGASVAELVALLAHPTDRIRYRAKIELSSRDSQEVLAAVDQFVNAPRAAQDEAQAHDLAEALWVYQHHNVVNVPLLERQLKSPDFRARAAAVRVLCYWRDRAPHALELLKQAAGDEAGRVRLEAIRAASFFRVPEALEVIAIAAERPSDSYLDYLTRETLKVLEPIFKQAMAENREVKFTTDAGARYLLRSVGNERLLQMPRTRGVYLEMLYRPGLQDAQRAEAVRGLAKLENKSELVVVIEAIRALDAKADAVETSVAFDLVRQLTGRPAAELAAARAELAKLATSAQQPLFRQIGFVSLMQIDGAVEKAWTLATTSTGALRDFVNSVGLIGDPNLRASLYPRLLPLLTELPANLNSPNASKGSHGRYVRIELPRRGTLTLAEVEVFSEGRNVARQGKASQKSTAHGGEAVRAIDGNKSGGYNFGGQTHTAEDTQNPWWEVDLGEEFPLDLIRVYNRTDGDLGQRLDGFTLTVLDAGRAEVFKQQATPAPKVSVEIPLAGGSPAAQVRRAAMLALTHIRGQEVATFKALARFVRDDGDRIAAIRALQRIPRTAWPQEEAGPLVVAVAKYVQGIEPAERTNPAALDALEFAGALTTLLPPEEARRTRALLRELGVPVIRVGTLLERMSYDRDVLAIQAGKPVEFLLENSDLMPHNFVILVPGALEEIGNTSEAMAQQPAFAARGFVPQSPKVLGASQLLQPREMQKLSFTAPSEPGVYPFVCTYPGHWRRMNGALYVVADLDAYLENPEAYLAANPLPIKDALLKDRRPRTEWTLDELTPAVLEMASGRSYGHGKQMFSVATCVACHKLGGEGNEFGPDLAKLDPAYKPVDILKHLLEPSFKIHEKYQTWVLELESGKTVTALILEETPQGVKIIENPLLKAEPVVLKPGDIVSRAKSTVSIMPKGLLDKLTRDEILDLVAFLTARGAKEHPLFQEPGGPGHGH